MFFIFQEQSQHFFIQSILKSKVSLKLYDRGKSGKQIFFFFYFGISLYYIFGSNHAKVFLKMGVPKKDKIPVKDKKGFIFNNVAAAGLQLH